MYIECIHTYTCAHNEYSILTGIIVIRLHDTGRHGLLIVHTCTSQVMKRQQDPLWPSPAVGGVLKSLSPLSYSLVLQTVRLYIDNKRNIFWPHTV